MLKDMDNLLRMEKISKSFPGVKALDSVHFELKRGEVHAIAGENGAGKSTFMKVLTGIYKQDEGEIYYKGNLIFKKDDARKFKRSPVFSQKKAKEGVGIYAFAFERSEADHDIIKSNLDTLRTRKEVVIITDAKTQKKFDLTGFHVYTVEPRHVYHKNYHMTTEVLDAFDKLRLLWTKEALTEDRYLTTHSVFVDLAQFEPSTFNRELNNIITMSNNDDHLILSASPNIKNETFSEEWLEEKFGHGMGELHPTVKFFGGKYENVEWLSNQFEAQYLWYCQLGKISLKDYEYLPLSILGDTGKVKLIEE